jgi:hypothetical protein
MANQSKRGTIRTSRAVYDPAIREVIVAGDLERMKEVLKEARALHEQQGDLPAAIARLENSIAKVS